MKIALSEIWNFIEMVDAGEAGWSFSLCAGKVRIDNLQLAEMAALKEDKAYDTELLPSLFTFREILWQPDVFTEASQSLPPLRILKAYCLERAEELEQSTFLCRDIYRALILGLGEACQLAIDQLEKDQADVRRILGGLRQEVFPIIKFFIYHPQNRKDYFIDAQNRLNYAVKVMLTQFYGRYTELHPPIWEVVFNHPKEESQNDSDP